MYIFEFVVPELAGIGLIMYEIFESKLVVGDAVL